jgi:hypothetical protein
MRTVLSTLSLLAVITAASGCRGSADASAAPSAAESAAASSPSVPAEAPAAPAPVEYRELTIPAGTVLPVELQSTVASDTSQVEDAVRARLRRAIVIDGTTALPAGSTLGGTVTEATRSGRVKGRARVGFRFNTIEPAGQGRETGGDERLQIRTTAVVRAAPATKRQDAAKIGIPAAGGAIIGGIVGGGDGAAKGAAIGGAAGTGVVLSTRGKEIRFGPGADFTVKLLQPVTVRVPTKNTN